MSETGPSDDTRLMVRVQAGDEPALAALMERWELPVKAVIGRIVLNSREAEELAQETLVRVWQQRGRFDPSAEFRPWVFAIAVNLARNRLRWWRRRPQIALDDWLPADAPVAAGGGSREASLPSEATERAECAAAVRAAVAALPVELREAIVLFEYEQLSHQEIGSVLGCSAKAVESRLYRARQKLRQLLARFDRVPLRS